MPSKKPRFTVIVDKEMMDRIQDYLFDNRLRNLSAAGVELIQKGFEVIATQQGSDVDTKDELEEFLRQRQANRQRSQEELVEKPGFTVYVEEELMEKIRDYCYVNRKTNLAAVSAFLIKKGLV